MDYYWIFKNSPMMLLCRTKNLAPIKIGHNEISALPNNYELYDTRREALDSLFEDAKSMSIKSAFREMFDTPKLKWKNKKNILQYIVSRLAIILWPIAILIFIPFFKFRFYLFKKYIEKYHPEWQI